MLLVILAALNVVSAFTTVMGARQVLPWPMSDVLGAAVQLMLFVALAGFVARHAPIRKWLVVGVFSFVSVYTSFFAYYGEIAGDSLAAGNLDRARQAHARFVDAVWQPQLAETEAMERKAAQLYDLAEREGSGGVTTGRVGFGPVARQYAEEARQTELVAAERRADLERVKGRFEVDADAMAAEQLYLYDLATWQQLPDVWKADSPMPERAAWLDLDQEVALVTPFVKVADGEVPALAALLLALMVDGTSILLGTAIGGRGRPVTEHVRDGVVGWVTELKDAGAAVNTAMRRPGAAAPDEIEPAGLEPARLVLRVTGRGTDFLGVVYEAVHPETRTVDAVRLLDHDEPSFRIAARVLLDRLRDPRVGWVSVEGGRWKVRRYDALTAWLAEQYRAACEQEARDTSPPVESYLALSVPTAVEPEVEEPGTAMVPALG
ncbi:MAG: hypothetical protein H6738_12635 [Alphaproteobacteria bacterium]|nr:hypothetical protein [Alphaproteobacteria bacterium]